MRFSKLLVLFFIVVSFSFCGLNETVKIKNPKKEEAKIIKINTDLFEIIAPELKTNKVYNLFIAIDPHADGKLASNKLKSISEKYNSIVIGLNNVENNIPDFIYKINKDIEVLKAHNVKINNLYLVGFSGGARMAFQYAQKNNVSGVVMCGAGPGNINQMNLSFNLVEIVGTRDFNFIEQYYSPYSNLVQKNNFLSLSFRGKHEWPPKELLLKASEFLLKKSNVNINKSNVSITSDSLNKYFEKTDFLSFKALESNYKINPSEENRQILISFLDKKEFKNYINKFEISLKEEMSRNQLLIQNLDKKDFSWWKNEINNIIKQSNKTDIIIADSYARTKAFIGILMYSKISAEIKNVNSTKIDKYLKIYEFAEPDNPDVQKFENMVREK